MPNSTTSNGKLQGDEAIKSNEGDLLGFKATANQLATAIANQASERGYVIGLEGVWGSGKSSLIELAKRFWEGLPKADQPIVFDFAPWLVGNRDALLHSLMDGLIRVIDVELKDARGTKAINGKKLAELKDDLQKFSSKLGELQALAQLAEITGTPYAGYASKFLGKLKKRSNKSPSLASLKKKLGSGLN